MNLKNYSHEYLVYILKCDNLTYVGMTNNFLQRWLQHNSVIKGGAKYTKKKCNWYPICILYGFKNKKEAMQAEWKIKSRKSKISKKYNGPIGKIQYINILLSQNKWTSNSPLIKSQNLKIHIDEEYKQYLSNTITEELYWK